VGTAAIVLVDDAAPEVEDIMGCGTIEGSDETADDGLEELRKFLRLRTKPGQHIESCQNLLPVSAFSKQGDGGNTTRALHIVIEVLLHRSHHQDCGHDTIYICRRGEGRHNDSPQIRVYDLLLDHVCH
jgi:hypothetical protein